MNCQLLKKKLELGFYVNNLYEMARLCHDKALENKYSASFFIMQKIFGGIADYWEKGPVIVEEAKLVQKELSEPIVELINAIEVESHNDKIMTLTNKLVSSYLFLFR